MCSSLNAKLNIKYIDKDYPSININNDGYGVITLGGLVSGRALLAATILIWSSGDITGGIVVGEGQSHGYIFGSANQTITGLKIRLLYADS